VRISSGLMGRCPRSPALMTGDRDDLPLELVIMRWWDWEAAVGSSGRSSGATVAPRAAAVRHVWLKPVRVRLGIPSAILAAVSMSCVVSETGSTPQTRSVCPSVHTRSLRCQVITTRLSALPVARSTLARQASGPCSRDRRPPRGERVKPPLAIQCRREYHRPDRPSADAGFHEARRGLTAACVVCCGGAEPEAGVCLHRRVL
jgi:hypothetical protein